MTGRRRFIGGLSALMAAIASGWAWARSRRPLSGPEEPPYEHVSLADCELAEKQGRLCKGQLRRDHGMEFLPHHAARKICVSKEGEFEVFRDFEGRRFFAEPQAHYFSDLGWRVCGPGQPERWVTCRREAEDWLLAEWRARPA